VQTAGNLAYFDRWLDVGGSEPARKLEVLQNWLGKAAHFECSLRISETPLA
jgi:hypothetical protein